jgi:DNA-binding transcriptional MerR regulator
MTIEPEQFTIQQVAALTGMTVHTLRYYERIGIMLPVGRAANGHRRYTPADVEGLRLLAHLLQTRMPLDQIQDYIRLYQMGESTLPERAAMLQTWRTEIQHQVDELCDTLNLIDKKLKSYEQLECKKQEPK